MDAILAVTVPFFALVLGGYLAAQRRILPESAIPGLNAFVLYFALPAMLLRFGMSLPLRELLNPTLLGVWGAVAALMVGGTLWATHRRRGPAQVDLKNAAFGALVSTFPNSGFMGVPLLAALLGPAAAGPVIATLLVDVFLTTSACLALARAHEMRGSGQGDSRWRQFLSTARAPLSNPQPWAIAIGATLSTLGWGLPGPLNVIVKMMADAASPVALFTIGAVLWRAGQHAHTRTPAIQVWPVAAAKLLLHPALVFAAGSAAQQLGAPISAFQLMVLTLCAALPSASNVSLLAERDGADNGRVARIILLSTALAFVTFTGLAVVFGAQPAG